MLILHIEAKYYIGFDKYCKENSIEYKLKDCTDDYRVDVEFKTMQDLTAAKQHNITMRLNGQY